MVLPFCSMGILPALFLLSPTGTAGRDAHTTDGFSFCSMGILPALLVPSPTGTAGRDAHTTDGFFFL